MAGTSKGSAGVRSICSLGLRSVPALAATEQLEPGDIFFFRNETARISKAVTSLDGYWSHSGIYVGGQRLVHAYTEGLGVTDLNEMSGIYPMGIGILRPDQPRSVRQGAATWAFEAAQNPAINGVSAYSGVDLGLVWALLRRARANRALEVFDGFESDCDDDDWTRADRVQLGNADGAESMFRRPALSATCSGFIYLAYRDGGGAELAIRPAPGVLLQDGRLSVPPQGSGADLLNGDDGLENARLRKWRFLLPAMLETMAGFARYQTTSESLPLEVGVTPGDLWCLSGAQRRWFLTESHRAHALELTEHCPPPVRVGSSAASDHSPAEPEGRSEVMVIDGGGADRSAEPPGHVPRRGPFLESALGRSLVLQLQGNQSAVAEIKRLIDGVAAGTYDQSAAFDAMRTTQKHRRWQSTVQIAEAVFATGVEAETRVVHRYAQALVELGAFTAAEHALESMSDRDLGDWFDEVHGLRGRINKQRFIDFGTAVHLADAVDAYATAFETGKSPEWHGGNLVALLRRAERDQLALPTSSAPDVTRVEEQLQHALSLPHDQLTFYQQAGLLELALSRSSGLADRSAHSQGSEGSPLLEAAARLATANYATPFEMSALRRQLVEVWQLDPSDLVIQTLDQNQLLLGVGAEIDVPESHYLEKIFGNQRPITLDVYRRGIQVARAVCKISTRYDEPVGSGFAVRGSFLHADLGSRLVVVTCNHVVDPTGRQDGSVLPDDAVIHFTRITDASEEVRLINPIVIWSSPELDVSVLAVDVPEQLGAAIGAVDRPPSPHIPDPHVFVVGHPSGRGIELSIRGNGLTDVDPTHLLYTAPTEVGSSGGPVFDPAWNLIGIHRSGRSSRPSLTNPIRRVAANEAVRIDAVIDALRNDPDFSLAEVAAR
ncbi:MAG: trypsin-like peptidase domain-containing protein [Actinobacteria bacterium]|nr:trypsin-like peptidase domain-containing protein [Actinomycetota bacterium]